MDCGGELKTGLRCWELVRTRCVTLDRNALDFDQFGRLLARWAFFRTNPARPGFGVAEKEVFDTLPDIAN